MIYRSRITQEKYNSVEEAIGIICAEKETCKHCPLFTEEVMKDEGKCDGHYTKHPLEAMALLKLYPVLEEPVPTEEEKLKARIEELEAEIKEMQGRIDYAHTVLTTVYRDIEAKLELIDIAKNHLVNYEVEDNAHMEIDKESV